MKNIPERGMHASRRWRMHRDIGRLLGVLLAVLIVATTFVFIYDFASVHEYTAFWTQSPGALMVYGRQPEAKYCTAYRTMAAQARAMGFVFTDPQLIAPNDLFNLWYVRWQRSPMIGVSNEGARYLMVDPLWMVQFGDDELDCVFAHEIGHVIEFQGKSDDHPLIRKLACLNTELRADGIGEYLCGKERFQSILLKHIPPESLKRRYVGVKRCEAGPVS